MKKMLGFTLIELLVVIVIISIVAGVAMLTLSTSQKKRSETLANQIANLITLAEEEAMLRPATLGIMFTSHSFEFYIWREDSKKNKSAWQALTKAPFTQHQLPDNVHITLLLSGKEAENNGLPQLIISPGGEITPFTLQVGRKNKDPDYQIAGKSNGEISHESA